VRAHRARCRRRFHTRIKPAAHRKAADYTVARTRFGMVSLAVDALLLLAGHSWRF